MTCCWVGHFDGQLPVPFRHGKAWRAVAHFLTQHPCPLPWLIGRYSFTAAWSKEVRKGKTGWGWESKMLTWSDCYSTCDPVSHPWIPPDSSVYRWQTGALREPACADGRGILLRGWKLWFPFKNQIASIFCPKGVCYNFCSTKGQFPFLLSSVVIMCVCKMISRNWKEEETTVCALSACLRNRSWGSLF